MAGTMPGRVGGRPAADARIVIPQLEVLRARLRVGLGVLPLVAVAVLLGADNVVQARHRGSVGVGVLLLDDGAPRLVHPYVVEVHVRAHRSVRFHAQRHRAALREAQAHLELLPGAGLGAVGILVAVVLKTPRSSLLASNLYFWVA